MTLKEYNLILLSLQNQLRKFVKLCKLPGLHGLFPTSKFVLNSPEIGESQSKLRRPGRGSLLAKAGPKLNIPLYMVVVQSLMLYTTMWLSFLKCGKDETILEWKRNINTFLQQKPVRWVIVGINLKRF